MKDGIQQKQIAWESRRRQAANAKNVFTAPTQVDLRELKLVNVVRRCENIETVQRCLILRLASPTWDTLVLLHPARANTIPEQNKACTFRRAFMADIPGEAQRASDIRCATERSSRRRLHRAFRPVRRVV